MYKGFRSTKNFDHDVSTSKSRFDYFNEIFSAHPPFTKAQELEFREKCLKEGKIKEMKDELVLRNVGIARKYGELWKEFIPPEDALSIGIIGLYNAFDKFDFEKYKDVRFTSHALFAVKNAFRDHIKFYRTKVDHRMVSLDKEIESHTGGDDNDKVTMEDIILKFALPGPLSCFQTVKKIETSVMRTWIKTQFEVIRKLKYHSTQPCNKKALEQRFYSFLLKFDDPDLSFEEIAQKTAQKFHLKSMSRERVRQGFIAMRRDLKEAMNESLKSSTTKSERSSKLRKMMKDLCGKAW